MMIERLAPCVFALTLFVLCSAAAAQGPRAAGQALPQGIQPHLRTVRGGRIDWANGLILAEGIGKARGRTEKDRLMAKRSGEVLAARNALAMALGLRIDGGGRFADLGFGEVHLRGVLKGHKIVSVDWRPNATPPACVVTIEAPIWGAKAVASIASAGAVRKALRRRRPRLAPEKVGQRVAEEILVIDARGLKVEPCLFPMVEEQGGAVLYDVATMRLGRRSVRPPIRYVETMLTFEELRASRQSIPREAALAQAQGGGSAPPTFLAVAGAFGVGSALTFIRAAPAFVEKPPPDRGAASQPTSKPIRRPRRRRRVVKAVKRAGVNKTRIVLTKRDAERLRKSAEGANLLRSGRVIVVVDSVAAGIEGRLDVLPDNRIFARSE